MQDSSAEQQSEYQRSLPAPYSSPWRALSQDLRSVRADLRLRAQEMWRRNREGDLSIPAFWPANLASLFWPALLVLSLTLLILGVIQVRNALVSQAPDSPPEIERVRTTPFPESRPLPIATTPESSIPTEFNSPINDEGEDQKAAEESSEPLEIDLDQRSPEKSPDLLRFDPLLTLLTEEVRAETTEGSALIVSATPQPERNAVILKINGAEWIQRSSEVRHELAESWWNRLEEQGYDELRLVNEQQELLARPARIGGGMIVFDPTRN